MKTLFKILVLALLALPLAGLTAETKEQPPTRTHKVVFEVAMEGAENWEAALRNVANVQKSLGETTTKIEVIAHGKGIGMLLGITGFFSTFGGNFHLPLGDLRLA